jgi:DNA-binding MarR family transcriptional regulator
MLPQRPGGKLALIIERLAGRAGATADELAEATGWQKHTVLGALSRLRARGFAMRLETEAGRKAYRLDRTEG